MEKADTLGDSGAYLKTEARQIINAAAFQASAIRQRAKQDADTIGIGLGYDIGEQQERNRLHPGQAHAMGIFASAAMHIREMLINSTGPNAELARQLGIEQLTGDRIQTIMAGRGSSFDPTAELVGPQPGSGSEQVADILKRIEDLLSKLTNDSLGDLGETNQN